MDSPFDTPDREAERAFPRLRLVADDETPEIREAWAAAREADRVEERILELLLISEYLEADDLLDAIDSAIEDCGVPGELAPERASPVHLVV